MEIKRKKQTEFFKKETYQIIWIDQNKNSKDIICFQKKIGQINFFFFNLKKLTIVNYFL